MTHSAAHDKAIEIFTTLGAYECEEYLAGKISVVDLAKIVSENKYDRQYRGIKNVGFERCLANVFYR